MIHILILNNFPIICIHKAFPFSIPNCFELIDYSQKIIKFSKLEEMIQNFEGHNCEGKVLLL